MADNLLVSPEKPDDQTHYENLHLNEDGVNKSRTSHSANSDSTSKPKIARNKSKSDLISNILSGIAGHENDPSLLTLLTKAEKLSLRANDSTSKLPVSKEAECLKICPEIIPRSEWKSRRPKEARIHQMRSVPPVLFKRTTAKECKTKEECLKSVKWMQTYHMEIYEFPDIAHSFLIGEDGNVYEGRGWGYQNQQGPGFVGIGYIGYYPWDSDNQPTRAMKRAALRIILCGIQKGFIKNPFKKGIKSLPNGLPDPEMWDKYLLQADDEF